MTNAKGFRLLGLSLIAGFRPSEDMPLPQQTSRFGSLYGINPLQTFQVWEAMAVPHKGRPKHLLWALFFLRQYDNTVVLCHLFNVSPKTLRKWLWPFVEAIAALKLVSLVGWLLTFGRCCAAHHSWSILFPILVALVFLPFRFAGRRDL